jgi:hypothetical protein
VLVVGTRAVHSDWWVVDRKRVCIERAMDLVALVVEAAAEGCLIVFVVCCSEAYPAVARVNSRMMTVLVVVEEVLRSMIVEACLAYSVGSWVGTHVAKWHIACCHILPHSERLIRRRRQLAVVSSPYVQLVLAQLVLRGCMP